MSKNHRSYNYKFTERTHSVKGIVGLILAIISVILGGVLVYISAGKHGAGPIYLGGAGFIALMISLTALVLAAGALKEEKSYRLFPVIATVVSLLSLLGWIAVYIVGLL